MTTPERDPRLEPKAGDRLRKDRRNGQPLFRKVTYGRSRADRRKGTVRFFESILRPGNSMWTEIKGAALADWRAWAKSATIITRGVAQP